jgi:imidazole glycerol phosphate synthase glutamine amidotransferase subunit
MIGILDYGMGNLGSVSNACSFLGLDAKILARPEEMDGCAAIILPGVGAFGDCMRHLNEHGFSNPVRAWIDADRPFLGICLGLQVLFEGSPESPGINGLGILPGQVRRFAWGTDFKVPQIGWNQVRQVQPDCPLFAGIPDESHFYFVHSYYADASDASVIAGETDYGIPYASAVRRGRMMAVQFHPEKSQQMGLRMLRNFRAAAVG